MTTSAQPPRVFPVVLLPCLECAFVASATTLLHAQQALHAHKVFVLKG